jgi:Na+/H+ antiporter NhaD/arsenite permease-like protein
MAAGFLAIVGAIYALLGVWCLAQPVRTAESIGYALTSGSGHSEYMTVYGGLQIGLGIVFLSALWRPADLAPLLYVALVTHGAIVALRTTSLVLHSGIETTTYVLAAVEWGVLLASAGFYFSSTME